MHSACDGASGANLLVALKASCVCKEHHACFANKKGIRLLVDFQIVCKKYAMVRAAAAFFKVEFLEAGMLCQGFIVAEPDAAPGASQWLDGVLTGC